MNKHTVKESQPTLKMAYILGGAEAIMLSYTSGRFNAKNLCQTLGIPADLHWLTACGVMSSHSAAVLVVPPRASIRRLS